MGKQNVFFIFIVFLTIGTGFCEQKAKILTATGKTREALFVRMRNDTIYLLVPKTNGINGSVSGHKTKFKKIEFSDGTLLDLSLSNYPVEHEIKLNGDIGDWPGGSPSPAVPQSVSPVPSPEPPPPIKSSFIEDSLALCALASQVQNEPHDDSSVQKKPLTESTGQSIVRETSDFAGGTIVINSKPSPAAITLDGKPIETTTPCTVKHLAPGKHSIRADKDSMYAFATVTVKDHKSITVSLHLKKESPLKIMTKEKKKKHSLAWSLCLSSVVLFAGSAASYYLALDDEKKALTAKDFLDQSLVPGKGYEENLDINRRKSNDARLKIKISDILLGIGALDMGLGIVFFF